jgi:hypothetical protein
LCRIPVGTAHCSDLANLALVVKDASPKLLPNRQARFLRCKLVLAICGPTTIKLNSILDEGVKDAGATLTVADGASVVGCP